MNRLYNPELTMAKVAWEKSSVGKYTLRQRLVKSVRPISEQEKLKSVGAPALRV